MTNEAHFGTRLKEERERLKLTQAELAELVGVRREMWARYEAGTKPGADVLSSAHEAGVDVLYVLTGSTTQELYLETREPPEGGAWQPRRGLVVGNVQSGKTATYSGVISWLSRNREPLVMPVLFEDTDIKREFQVIDRIGAEASAGRGLGNGDRAAVETEGIMALDRRWMEDNFGRSGPGFATVTVRGDSMESTLFDGETIVIDTKVGKIDVSGIYVIKAGANVLVKRVQLKFDGSIVLKSDNPAYDPEPLSPIEAGQVKVMGRLVWPRVR